jgi:hypothetical protein
LFIINHIFDLIISFAMLQKLSYFNLIFAIAYLLIYLKSGTFNSSAGIFFIIILNWLCLRSYQLDQYRWSLWHYLVALWCLYFVGTLVYGAIHILISAVEVDFISNDTLTFLAMSLGFSIAIFVHIILYWVKNNRELNS